MTPDPHTHREAGFVLLRELLRARYAGLAAPAGSSGEGNLRRGERVPEFLDNAFDEHRQKAFREEGVRREKAEGSPQNSGIIAFRGKMARGRPYAAA